MSGGFKNKGPGGGDLTAEEELWVQTGTAGVLLLAELAIAPSPTSGFGKVYVKTDKHIYYMDEDGVETQLDTASVAQVDRSALIYMGM